MCVGVCRSCVSRRAVIPYLFPPRQVMASGEVEEAEDRLVAFMEQRASATGPVAPPPRKKPTRVSVCTRMLCMFVFVSMLGSHRAHWSDTDNVCGLFVV